MRGPSPHLSVDRVRIFAWTKSAFRCGSVNHATSSKLYRTKSAFRCGSVNHATSSKLYRSRELVSPVCGIFTTRPDQNEKIKAKEKLPVEKWPQIFDRMKSLGLGIRQRLQKISFLLLFAIFFCSFRGPF